MRFLVTGARGMLGQDVLSELANRHHEIGAYDKADLDICDPTAMARLAAGEFGAQEWVINCAAYTAVDKAETEVREAHEANALGPGYLARATAALGAKLIHVSTDFVFDGTADKPYTEDALTHPLGVYGRTKRDGEDAVLASQHALVVRTAWLYGPLGNSFPRTMIRAFLAGRQLKVVSDQIGCPTYTADLARVLVDLAEKDAAPGIYHAVGRDAMNWHAFAVLAISAWLAGHGRSDEVDIEPIPSADWPTPAARPKYSVLSTVKLEALGIAPMRPVNEALQDFALRLPEP